MSDAWQPFGGPVAVPEQSAAQPQALSFRCDASPGQGAYAEIVARQAAAIVVPASLVHRAIVRESRYNPRAVSKGNHGMMQIRLSTAREIGYTGSQNLSIAP
jgi:soluble lytic murein transglycosylase-like protein